jgi:hypothetical protein
MPVVPGPADASERTHPRNRKFALRQGARHRLDDSVDPVTPAPAFGWRCMGVLAPDVASRTTNVGCSVRMLALLSRIAQTRI